MKAPRCLYKLHGELASRSFLREKGLRLHEKIALAVVRRVLNEINLHNMRPALERLERIAAGRTDREED